MKSSQETTGADQATALFAIFDVTPRKPHKFDHDQGETHSIFHQFRKFPQELRYAIWEHTWPPPRLICMALYKDEGSHEYTDLAACECFDDQLSRLCRVPMALHVCSESRRHTMTQYRTIKHEASRNARVYINPSRDLLWADTILMDELQNLMDLGRCYARQLALIEMLFVNETDWSAYHESGSTCRYLAPFTGLKTIVILLEENIEDNDEQMNAADARIDHNSNSEEDSNRDIEDKNEDRKSELGNPLFQNRAGRLKAGYRALLNGREASTQIRCVDKTGIFY